MMLAETANVRRILLIRPNHRLGNNVLMTPLLTEIEALFPQARIDVLTGGRASHDLYAGFPQIASVHAFPAWSYIHPGKTLTIIRRIRQESYDLAIDPIPRSRSARLLLGLVNAQYKLGYRWGRRWRDAPLTHMANTHTAPKHLGQMPVHLVRSLCGNASMRTPTLDLRLSEAEKSMGKRLLHRALGEISRLSQPGLRVLRIGVYGSATGKKQYSPRWWSAFLDDLQRGLEATPHELIELLPHDGRSTFAGCMPSLLSNRLRELGAVLSALDVFITADCGVMHLSSAAGTQTIGLFKVTDAARYGPYGHGSASICAEDTAPKDAARAVVDHIRRVLPRESQAPLVQLSGRS
jgi:ADP-heptose:LPS heptosyltransferase